MVAQDEAVTRILQLNKKFDTVMVYPAFGNEVSKAKALNSSEILGLYHWLTSCFARKSDMCFFANQMHAKLVHSSPTHEQKKFNRLIFSNLEKSMGLKSLLFLERSFLVVAAEIVEP